MAITQRTDFLKPFHRTEMLCWKVTQCCIVPLILTMMVILLITVMSLPLTWCMLTVSQPLYSELCMLHLTWLPSPVSEGLLLSPWARGSTWAAESIKTQQARAQLMFNTYTHPTPRSRPSMMLLKAHKKCSPWEIEKQSQSWVGRSAATSWWSKKKKIRKSQRGATLRYKFRNLKIIINLRKRIYFEEPVI